MVSQSVYSNTLPMLDPIAVQEVYPGQNFVYRVTAIDVNGKPPVIRMQNAPKGASLTAKGDGSSEFRWQLPTELAAENVIIFQAIDAQDSSLFTTQRMVLRKGSSEPTGSNLQATQSKINESAITDNRTVLKQDAFEKAELMDTKLSTTATEQEVAETVPTRPSMAKRSKPEPVIKIAEISSAATAISTASVFDEAQQTLQTNQDRQLPGVLSNGLSDEVFFKSFSVANLAKQIALLIIFAYVVFVFIAEDFNPFFNRQYPVKRKRWRLGRAAAVASIAAGIFSAVVMQKLDWSPFLALACFVCLTLLLMTPSAIKYKRSQVWQ